MFLPPLDAKGNKRTQILRFGGLDQREKAAANTLSQAENICSDAYPALSVSKARRAVATANGVSAIVPPEYTEGSLDSFTGVREGRFYYRGEPISGSLTDGEKSIADFNGKICIFPDKLYYDYLPDPDTGSAQTTLKSMEKSLTISGVKFYSSLNKLTGEYSAYLQKTNGGFDRFSAGESIVISGSSSSENNTCSLRGKRDYASDTAIVSAVVKASSGNRLDLLLYTKGGSRALFTNMTESGAVTVKTSIPDMDHICVHNNRLWGTASNGEYLYASKLGDCFNFNSFQGLSDDSWYSAIGTPGGFTGICSYRAAIVAFKRDCIHHVYGDAPQNFSIPKQIMSGCIDGRSIAELGGILYYLSPAGFSGYSGGEPFGISPQLKKEYVSCAAGTDGKKYYAAACDKDGECDVLVFDPEFNVWHREDNTLFIAFMRYGGKLYGATRDSGIWELGAGGGMVEWSFTTNRITYDAFEHKGLSCMWLRLDAEKDAHITVSVSPDGGEFKKCAEVKGNGYAAHRIPIRFGKCDSFRIKVSGAGAAVVHDMELITHTGGRTYAI